ncbi:MAG: sigma-70 family RNA polymerase sigma factor [Clostridium sp.]|nr:sigma-70 family RNA polymerase sigma factor [Clostridium sp.]
MRTQNETFDSAAFYERYYDTAVRYAQTFLTDEDESRDAVGDTMLRMLEISDRLDDERNVRSLFFSMVHNRCMDLLRRRQCYQGVENYLTRTANHCTDDELTRLCQRELFRIIGSTVRQMPECERTVFVGIRLDGESYKTVSERTGLSCRSVEYQLKKSTDRIKNRLQQMYG